ncbi:hypothetical protein Tco_1436165, partial [Tanacetum coccineum]
EGKALDYEVIMSMDDIVMDFAIDFTESMYWNCVYRNQRVANKVARINRQIKSRHVTKLTLSIMIRRGKALDWEVKRRREEALDWEVIMSIDDIVMEFAIEFTEIILSLAQTKVEVETLGVTSVYVKYESTDDNINEKEIMKEERKDA